MSWNPVLKKNLLKSIPVGPVNSAQDPHKNATTSTNANAFVSKLTLRFCLRFAYFAEIENFFAKNTIDKGKN